MGEAGGGEGYSECPDSRFGRFGWFRLCREGDMKSFKTIRANPKFNKSVRIHFAVGNWKGNY